MLTIIERRNTCFERRVLR